MTSAVRYVDTHCHLDRYPDPARVLEDARAAGALTIAVTERPSQFPPLRTRIGRSPLVRVALGAHPLRANELNTLELRLFDRFVDDTDYVGEVGLDFSAHGRATKARQLRCFEHVLAHPRITEKVLSVHSRGAEAETITRLASARAPTILHWYSGALKHLDNALDAGMCFSVNLPMLRAQKGRRLLAALPPERVLAETDGPYTRTAERTSEPQDIPTVVAGLARIWDGDAMDVRQRLIENLTTLFARRASATGHGIGVPDSGQPVPTVENAGAAVEGRAATGGPGAR